ncbi:hypothetical protein T4B_13102 [Trichinella pseudospiralis]|uniref:Uncharacterized protein n=1 Tax=Trichinella pseudospiralis TaxID=6337 RepID=A0A0V1K2D2_TRIPS|nr:hypothetical protein T4A_6664 [Trichinella pseudospiralis]KRZ08571.1 hypothetical protein T4B_13102 [Trichinella pseudospiralis]KRZ41355.1 hypothetical protein T4C_7947 [Trichinella pseudospiralis]
MEEYGREAEDVAVVGSGYSSEEADGEMDEHGMTGKYKFPLFPSSADSVRKEVAAEGIPMHAWHASKPAFTAKSAEDLFLLMFYADCIRDVLIADHNYKSVRAARLGLTAER